MIASNPHYATFLDNQIKHHGRDHPIIAAEYFLEPLDAQGSLFDKRRRTLFFGTHTAYEAPRANHIYIATVDVAGQDEQTTEPHAALANPGRDYTCATVWEVNQNGETTYNAISIFLDHGSRHFENSTLNPSLSLRLLSYLKHFHITHTIIDESGVGEGLTSWFKQKLPGKVTGFKFNGKSKAWLGSAFITLIETGRVKYFTSTTYQDNAWWMNQQMKACTYHLPPGGNFDTHLQWYVPSTHKTETPTGHEPTHDDRLMSAALITVADRMITTGEINTGRAESKIIPAIDPLNNLTF